MNICKCRDGRNASKPITLSIYEMPHTQVDWHQINRDHRESHDGGSVSKTRRVVETQGYPVQTRTYPQT